jgi:hypothetical protein
MISKGPGFAPHPKQPLLKKYYWGLWNGHAHNWCLWSLQDGIHTMYSLYKYLPQQKYQCLLCAAQHTTWSKLHTYYAQFCNTYIYNFQASPGHRAKAYSCFSTLHKNLKPCGQEDDNFVQCQLCVQVTGCCLNEWRLQSIFFDPAFCSVWPVVLWNKAPNFVKILPKLEPYIRTFAQRNFRSKFGNFKTKRSTNLELIQANFGRLKK